jgi:hypothetical protein
VIEESNARRNVIGSTAVEVDGGFDLGLLGGALDAGLTLHGVALLASPNPRLYQLGLATSIDASLPGTG